MLVAEIAEYGIREKDGGGAGTINISLKDLLSLLQMISQNYDVSMDWLMYGKGAERGLNAYAKPPRDELTLFLPVTISGDSLVDEMTRTLALVDADESRAEERAELHRDYLQSILQKLYFYEQYAAASKLSGSVKLARKRIMDVVKKCRSGSNTKR